MRRRRARTEPRRPAPSAASGRPAPAGCDRGRRRARRHRRPRAQPRDRAIGPPADRARLLAPRAAIPPQVPPGVLLADLRSREPLVLAVVPLAQVLADLGPVAEAGELARLAGPPQRAHQHERESHPASAGREPARSRPFRSGQVGAARVLAAEAPLGFAVANENYVHPPNPRVPPAPQASAAS